MCSPKHLIYIAHSPIIILFKYKFIPQIESLQRQFKLASSEVDSLQAIESDLVKERSYLQNENAKLVEERKTFAAKLKELEGAFRKSELLKKAVEQEKLSLEVSC